MGTGLACVPTFSSKPPNPFALSASSVKCGILFIETCEEKVWGKEVKGWHAVDAEETERWSPAFTLRALRWSAPKPGLPQTGDPKPQT